MCCNTEVGRTTVATAIAEAPAERGRVVLLTMTDPPGNLADMLNGTVANRTQADLEAIGLIIPQLSDLDLSCTPPLAAPWDAIQAAAQHWQ